MYRGRSLKVSCVNSRSLSPEVWPSSVTVIMWYFGQDFRLINSIWVSFVQLCSAGPPHEPLLKLRRFLSKFLGYLHWNLLSFWFWCRLINFCVLAQMNRAAYLLSVLTYSDDSVYTKLMLRGYLNVLVWFINEFYEYGQNSLGTDFNKMFMDDRYPTRTVLTARTFNLIYFKIRVNTFKCETNFVHRKCVQTYIQQDATLHSLTISGNCSACFGWCLHISSGAHTTVFTASGTCQT